MRRVRQDGMERRWRSIMDGRVSVCEERADDSRQWSVIGAVFKRPDGTFVPSVRGWTQQLAFDSDAEARGLVDERLCWRRAKRGLQPHSAESDAAVAEPEPEPEPELALV
jgi:hypothetical protein